MDLNEVLNKTKKKSTISTHFHKPPIIAFDDRPYSIDDFQSSDENSNNNLGQIQDKPRTNPGQTGNKQTKNLGQTQDKPKTNLGQFFETQDKPKTEPRTESRTNLGQIQDKLSNSVTFSSLVGLQREVVFFIYEQCKLSRDKITTPLSSEHLATSCKTTILSIQKTTQRLSKRQVIIRSEYKCGRGGWTRYELPESIFQEVLHAETHEKLRTNLGQTQDKPKTEPKTEPRTSSSSSSSVIKNITTTTSDEPSDFEALLATIDLSPLEDTGLTKTHLTQILQQGKLTPEIIQSSINAFAFDLKRNEKGKALKKDPVSYFMGILRNGNPYAPPSNYESPQAEAMRLYIEMQTEITKRETETENTAMEFAFNGWVNALSEDEKSNLIPEPLRKLNGPARLGSLRSHFREKIWPVKRAEIFATARK